MSANPHRPSSARSDLAWSGLDALVASQASTGAYWYLARADHPLLSEILAAWPDTDDPVRRLLAAKLHRGIVCDADQLPREVVTIGAPIQFRFADESWAGTLTSNAAPVAGEIAVASPLGAVLLGLFEGRPLRIQGADGTSAGFVVTKVNVPATARAA